MPLVEQMPLQQYRGAFVAYYDLGLGIEKHAEEYYAFYEGRLGWVVWTPLAQIRGAERESAS